MHTLDELKTDIDRAQGLQYMLVSHATGGNASDDEYRLLRSWLIGHRQCESLAPAFVRRCRDTNQFWQFIKNEYGTYAERRAFIYDEFQPLLDYLEGKDAAPADKPVADVLKVFSEDSIHALWEKALDRRTTDPEGAITLARSLLESVCKHILDESQITYKGNVELSELYKLVAESLNLAAGQHTEGVFRQILGGCSGVVNGLGSLRNKIGDAHGQGKKPVKPAARHAELAVNLAGSMALFLVSSWTEKNRP